MTLGTIVRRAAVPFLVAGAIVSGACAQPEIVDIPVVNPPAITDNSTNSADDGQSPIVIQETLESKIYTNLLLNVPEIKEFPERVANSTVNQIKTTIYDNGFAGNEQRAWSYIAPAVKFGLEAMAKIDFNKYKNIEDNNLSQFELYVKNFKLDWNKYSDEEIGQVLLPINLGQVNLQTGEKTRFSLETALFNVTPNSELGNKSPQEWVTEITLEDYNNKPENNEWALVNLDGLSGLAVYQAVHEWDYNLNKNRPMQESTPYENAIRIARSHTNGNAYAVDKDGNRTKPKWNNSNDAYQKTVNELLIEGNDFSIFLRGHPIALRVSGRISPNYLDGDDSQFYSDVQASRLGIPAKVLEGVYPTSSEGGLHREVYVFNPNFRNDDPLLSNYVGFWLKKGPFEQDYVDKSFNIPSVWTIGMGDRKAMIILPPPN